MKGPGKKWSTGLLSFFLLFGALKAQQTGEIKGRVTDGSGEALPGVSITARSPSLQGLRTMVTDPSGGFWLPLLPVGTYDLTFELPGFEKLTMAGSQVRLGLSSSLSVVMKPSAVNAEVTVVASNPLIDKSKADTSYRLNSEDLALAPTQARTIAEIVNLTPGVTGVRTNTVTGGANPNWIPALTTESGLPGFRGEGNGANNWLVDGLSTKGAAYGDPGVRLNYDAWEEVQIVADGFAPEMGHGVGGFINIVTKSGSNAFHGQLGGLIQGAGLRAERKPQMSSISVPETSLGQYFGNLGGSIIKDRLWFFFSDNLFSNIDRNEEQTLVWLTVPAARKRVATNNVFGKVTLTPFVNHTVSFSGTFEDLLDHAGGIGAPETFTKTDYTRYSLRLNYRGILSPNTVLTAAWGRNRNEYEIRPLSGDFGPAPYHWQDIGQDTNNAGFSQWALERRTDLSVGLIQYLDLGRFGSHEIKVGGSYYNYGKTESWHWTGLDIDEKWPDDGYDNGCLITWAGPGNPLSLVEYAVGEADDTTHGFGFYAEDNAVLGRFSFMLGLRTDTQQVFNDAGKEVWSWGVGDFLQPRATVAWDIAGNGRNVLKFGFGVYSMPLSTSSLPFANTRPLFARCIVPWSTAVAYTSESQLKERNSWDWAKAWEQNFLYEVDPALEPNKTFRYLLEFDRQLSSNWAIKVRGIASHSGHLINPISVYDPAAPILIKRVLTNFELKRRNYRGLEVELNGKFPDLLMVNASWTWSRAKGTAAGDFFEPASWDLYFGGLYDSSLFGYHPSMPEGPLKDYYDRLFAGTGGRGIGDEGWYGILPYSVDHVIKLVATWFAPYGIAVSAGVDYLSGYHWEKKGYSPAATYCVTFLPEGRGARTTPPHMYVDIAVEKDIPLRRGLMLGVGLNAYNLLNSQRPVSYFKSGEIALSADKIVPNPLFGQVWARQLPRWVQLKFSVKF